MKDETAACEMIEHLAFTTGPGIGARARIGLVVLASDYMAPRKMPCGGRTGASDVMRRWDCPYPLPLSGWFDRGAGALGGLLP